MRMARSEVSGGRFAILIWRVPIPAISKRTTDIFPVVCLYSKRPVVVCSTRWRRRVINDFEVHMSLSPVYLDHF